MMRAFVTLEGIALSADDSFNMYSVAAPFARYKHGLFRSLDHSLPRSLNP